MKLAPVILVVLSLSTPAAADSISGTVKLTGKPPKRDKIAMTSAPGCPQDGGQLDESVIVGAGGGLRDVHVRIKSGTAGQHTAPKAAVTIDQKGCMYRPRVTGAMAGQIVQVINSDPLLHNVHSFRGARSDANRAQPKGAKPVEFKKLGDAGSVFELKCDVHRWMVSYVPLTDHPFFAVTGDDGSFSIKGLPAGTYTIEAIHEKLGTKTGTATVAENGTATVSLSFGG